MIPFPYRILVRWSSPDDAWVASIPALPGSGGDGPTAEEALHAAQESGREFLELKKQYGDPIPPPDNDEPEFSGQLRLRLPRSLHRELAQAAECEGVSLNQLMVTYLALQVRAPAPAAPVSPMANWVLGPMRLDPHRVAFDYSCHQGGGPFLGALGAYSAGILAARESVVSFQFDSRTLSLGGSININGFELDHVHDQFQFKGTKKQEPEPAVNDPMSLAS